MPSEHQLPCLSKEQRVGEMPALWATWMSTGESAWRSAGEGSRQATPHAYASHTLEKVCTLEMERKFYESS
jgi:hypothetical protein